jgi:hypothetical protein
VQARQDVSELRCGAWVHPATLPRISPPMGQ